MEKQPTAMEARYYQRLDGGLTRCLLCPHQCLIRPGKRGICRVRENQNGRLTALGYGYCSSLAMDPIEKKPLYHFYPGAMILSVGTVGCNFACAFCQNWEISQATVVEDDAPDRYLPADTLVRIAEKEQDRGCIGIAYTYSEPLVWYEYVLDVARKAHQKGLRNVLVTNGYIEPDPFQELIPWVDALNIDVKSFSEDFYRGVVHGRRDPVLRTVETAVRAGKHVEVTTLLVTGLNDNWGEIDQLVDWLSGLNPTIPLHFSRYFPQYRMDRPATPVSTLQEARKRAQEKLFYVYLGNVPGGEGSDTICPQCGQTLVRRLGYHTTVVGLKGKECSCCGRKADIVV